MIWVNLTHKRRCGKCHRQVPRYLFCRSSRSKDGLAWACRHCMNSYGNRYRAYKDAWISAHRKRVVRASREAHLLRKYGLTLDEFDALVLEQCGRCASCGDPMVRVDVDHDHRTGVVRGLLCHPCNVALGLVQDQPQRLRLLADYLEGGSRGTDELRGSV